MRFNTSEINKVMHNGKEITAFRHKGEILFLNQLGMFKAAGTKMLLMADQLKGFIPDKLKPRTLPNGVRNSDTIQRVSGDVPLTAADINYFEKTENTCIVRIFKPTLSSGYNNTTMYWSVLGEYTEASFSYTLNNTVEKIGKYASMQISTQFVLILPLDFANDLAEAKAKLTGTVIRYQLATPIDTLNTPPPTPWIDLANSVGKNLFDKLAVVKDYSVRWNTGTLSLATGTFASMPISVESNTQYTVSNKGTVSSNFGVAFYDSNGIYISGVSSTAEQNQTFTTPPNATTLRFSIKADGNIDICQLELGSVATAYEPYAKNNALMQGLANTADSGMAYVPLVCETGTPVEYTNLVPDPLFSDIAPWIVLNGSKSTSGGILTLTGNGASTLLRAVRDLGVKPSNNSRLSQRIRVRVNQSGVTSFNALLRDGQAGTILGSASVSNPVAGQWYSIELAQIVNCGILVENVHLFVSATYPDAATQNGKTLDIEKPQVVSISTPQITALESQLSTPLTALECDRIFPFVTTTGVSKIAVRPLMVFDGINDYGVLVNNPSIDIVGTGDFAIAVGFLTPSVLQTGFILAKSSDSLAVNRQFSLYLGGDGAVTVFLGGVGVTTLAQGTISANSFNQIEIERVGGILKIYVNGVLKYNLANSTALVSKPNLRIGAISAAVDGATHTVFFKGGIAWAIIATGTEVANLDKALDSKARDYRMMG